MSRELPEDLADWNCWEHHCLWITLHYLWMRKYLWLSKFRIRKYDVHRGSRISVLFLKIIFRKFYLQYVAHYSSQSVHSYDKMKSGP